MIKAYRVYFGLGELCRTTYIIPKYVNYLLRRGINFKNRVANTSYFESSNFSKRKILPLYISQYTALICTEGRESTIECYMIIDIKTTL